MLIDDDFLCILNGIGKLDVLVVKIVDIFDFNGSWLFGLYCFVGNNKVLFVGNKVDLILKLVKYDKVKYWMCYSVK